MPLKLVEQFDSSFVLDPDAKDALVALITSDAFCTQIQSQMQAPTTQSGEDERRPEFTGILFQPVPYTPNEPKGMPTACEQYHDSPDYIIINVPPNFMFKAKIFNPSRLCAIYKR